MINYTQEIQQGYKNKLKGRLFGLLCEYEKEREWEKFLDSILIELNGFPDDDKTIDYYTLHYKLSACRYLSYKYFRQTIFDAMSIVDKMEV